MATARWKRMSIRAEKDKNNLKYYDWPDVKNGSLSSRDFLLFTVAGRLLRFCCCCCCCCALAADNGADDSFVVWYCTIVNGRSRSEPFNNTTQ